jgi:hypothetical protein
VFDAGTIMIHEKLERKLAACKHAETVTIFESAIRHEPRNAEDRFFAGRHCSPEAISQPGGNVTGVVLLTLILARSESAFPPLMGAKRTSISVVDL